MTITDMRLVLRNEIDRLHSRHELSGDVSDDYYEPGMMEYLEQSDGYYCAENGTYTLRFEAKGTRYQDRTEQIERVSVNDPIQVVRDNQNLYNSSNFALLTAKGKDIGNMPAELCEAIAPLYDCGALTFERASVSYMEPISKRSRHAKQAILFIELVCRENRDTTPKATVTPDTAIGLISYEDAKGIALREDPTVNCCKDVGAAWVFTSHRMEEFICDPEIVVMKNGGEVTTWTGLITSEEVGFLIDPIEIDFNTGEKIVYLQGETALADKQTMPSESARESISVNDTLVEHELDPLANIPHGIKDLKQTLHEMAFDEWMSQSEPVNLDDIWGRNDIEPIAIGDKSPLLEKVKKNVYEIFVTFDQAKSPSGIIKAIFDLGIGVYNYQEYNFDNYNTLEPFDLGLQDCFVWLTYVQRSHYWDGRVTKEYDLKYLALKNRICQLLWDKFSPEFREIVEQSHETAGNLEKEGKVRVFHADKTLVAEYDLAEDLLKAQGMMTRISLRDGNTIDGFITDCSELPLNRHPFKDSIEIWNWRYEYFSGKIKDIDYAFEHAIIPIRDIAGIDAMTYTHPRWDVYVNEFKFETPELKETHGNSDSIPQMGHW